MPDMPKPKNPALALKVATDGRNEPMNYFLEGRLTGFDVEFAKRLALFLNADLTLISIEYPAIVTAALSGKIDLVTYIRHYFRGLFKRLQLNPHARDWAPRSMKIDRA